MTMISYAQDHEDVLLARVFPDVFDGVYIDAGANDPVEMSVTKYFSERGWRGINVEPNPALCARLAAARPRDVNLNVGLSDRDGVLKFYECPAVHGWSTFSPVHAAHFRARGLALREYDVPVTTLAGVCARHGVERVEFLKIDVEGFEREVILGADWARWRPRVVLVENAEPERWEPLLFDAGYLRAAETAVNRYYVREEDRHLAAVLAEPVGAERDDFLYHNVAHAVRPLNERLARGEAITATTLGVACRLHRVVTRHPRLARACKAVFRRVG